MTPDAARQAPAPMALLITTPTGTRERVNRIRYPHPNRLGLSR